MSLQHECLIKRIGGGVYAKDEEEDEEDEEQEKEENGVGAIREESLGEYEMGDRKGAGQQTAVPTKAWGTNR